MSEAVGAPPGAAPAHPIGEPYDERVVEVGDGHRLHVEQYGNPDGKPAVVLHGGPGGGISPKMRAFYDPDAYRVVLFDQRGCGRSTPHAATDPVGALSGNTTWDLVADTERIREELGIERWQVFGGSWGSTLALAYAQTHPERVTELVLRGVFMLRPLELRWFYQEGASRIFPDAWESYLAPIPEAERGDLLGAYHRRLHGDDEGVALEAARAWTGWELATSHLEPCVDDDDPDAWILAFARIESHYFANGGFLSHPDQLLDGVDGIGAIPGVIVQGRYDVVCPAVTAWDLHRRWPEAELVITLAGHSALDPANTAALVAATDRLGRTSGYDRPAHPQI